MPKRRSRDKLEHYKRKIKKLEEKEKTRKHHTTYSLNQESFTDVINDDNQDQIPLMPSPALEAVLQSDVAQTTGATRNEVVSTAEPATTELDPELLAVVGAGTSDALDFGEPIHDSLANLWNPLPKKGLPKADKEALMKEYPIPSNCKLLQAPKLNPEISAAVAEIVRNRDKKQEGFQQALGAGTSAINRGLDLLLTIYRLFT